VLDLEALRIFVKVAELASFTRAAEQLGMPKARVSLRVRELEASLGVLLLQRTTRTVRATDDGEQLLPRARQLVIDGDEVAALFQSGRALRGVVRVDLPIGLARDLVIPRLPDFLAAHPHLEILLSTTDRRVEVAREGFDLVLRIGNLTPSALMVQRLGAYSIVNCASAGYVKKYGTPRTLADLDKHLLVHYALTLGASVPAFEYARGSAYAEKAMKSVITVNSVDAYRAACLAGLGIIQAPRVGMRALLEDGALVEVLPDLVAEPMPVSLLHSHGKTPPKRVRAVMAFLASVVAPRLDLRHA
jgi:DNA-binding transcriptional LysR family regulator